MEIRFAERFNQSFSRYDVAEMCSFLLSHPEFLASAVQLLSDGTHDQIKNVAWVLLHVGQKNVLLMAPYLDRIVICAKQAEQEMLRRPLLFIIGELLQYLDKEKLNNYFELYDFSIQIIISPQIPPGTRSNAINIAMVFCKAEPDLAPELISYLQMLIPDSPPGFKSRAIQTLKALELLIH